MFLSVSTVSSVSTHHASHYVGRAVPAVGVSPKYVLAHATSPGAATFSCQAPESTTNPVPCYGPQQIRTAYNVPPFLTGAGQTIVIIDAFGDPYIASDLALFDSTFGLPAARLNIICIAATTPTVGACPTFVPNADEYSWAGEIALDTQYSHAIAPGATIDLVISNSDQDTAILQAQEYVANHNLGSVLSQSFGEDENCAQYPADPSYLLPAEHASFQTDVNEGMTVFASSGDSGAAQVSCATSNYGEYEQAVSTPASDPLVTAVGATHLDANYTTGAYESETVWNDSEFPALTPIDFGASGGGFSKLYSEPTYQEGVQHTGARGVPDVAWSGDVYDGVLVACSECALEYGLTPPQFFIFGGTSCGSPQWAAVIALADQLRGGIRVGFINPTLYAIAGNPVLYHLAFHDVTIGNNSWAGITGYSATPGWDPTTGLGSPNVSALVSLLIAAP
jgi:subtilase family serine protease